MIKYLGSKRRLIAALTDILGGVEGTQSLLDLFSGTARVGSALKRHGLRVVANDHNQYAHTLATCYVQADAGVLEEQARAHLEELGELAPTPGYVTKTFCEDARFFTPENGARIDAIRDAIEAKELAPELKAVLLTALLEAADRVDSTCGVQMAYLKKYAPRAHQPLQLRLPLLAPRPVAGACTALCLDATEAAKRSPVDVAYLDPPYNQHSYLGNYHVWETIVRWDKPEAYGTARKRVDVRERKSAFNSRPGCAPALESAIDAVDAKVLVVSFNDEGHISLEQMRDMLSTRGDVEVLALPTRRYVGAQIGVHNPAGVRVGEISHLHNHELIFRVRPPTTPKSVLRPLDDICQAHGGVIVDATEVRVPTADKSALAS